MTFFLFVFHVACGLYPWRYCVILGQRTGSEQINQSYHVYKVNAIEINIFCLCEALIFLTVKGLELLRLNYYIKSTVWARATERKWRLLMNKMVCVHQANSSAFSLWESNWVGKKRHFVFASEGMLEKKCRGEKRKSVGWIKDSVHKEKGPVNCVVIVRIFYNPYSFVSDILSCIFGSMFWCLCPTKTQSGFVPGDRGCAVLGALHTWVWDSHFKVIRKPYLNMTWAEGERSRNNQKRWRRWQ